MTGTLLHLWLAMCGPAPSVAPEHLKAPRAIVVAVAVVVETKNLHQTPTTRYNMRYIDGTFWLLLAKKYSSPGGGGLASGRQLPPELTVGRRPLGGGSL